MYYLDVNYYNKKVTLYDIFDTNPQLEKITLRHRKNALPKE
jgi:hypothetical protein